MVFYDYFAILEIDVGASEADVTKAYRKLAIATHPDKNPGRNTTEEFKLIGTAYNVLKDPQSRRTYMEEYEKHQPLRSHRGPAYTPGFRPRPYAKARHPTEPPASEGGTSEPRARWPAEQHLFKIRGESRENAKALSALETAISGADAAYRKTQMSRQLESEKFRDIVMAIDLKINEDGLRDRIAKPPIIVSAPSGPIIAETYDMLMEIRNHNAQMQQSWDTIIAKEADEFSVCMRVDFMRRTSLTDVQEKLDSEIAKYEDLVESMDEEQRRQARAAGEGDNVWSDQNAFSANLYEDYAHTANAFHYNSDDEEPLYQAKNADAATTGLSDSSPKVSRNPKEMRAKREAARAKENAAKGSGTESGQHDQQQLLPGPDSMNNGNAQPRQAATAFFSGATANLRSMFKRMPTIRDKKPEEEQK